MTTETPEIDEALAALREARNDSDEWQLLHAALFAEVETLKAERDEALKELNQWRDAAKGAENPHPDEVHCTCVPLLRGSLELARKERDKALEDAKRATYDAAQETIKVSTVKSHWIEACRERDEARADANYAEKESSRMRAALQRLADCDWVITPHDRMDAVRKIARDALGPSNETI